MELSLQIAGENVKCILDDETFTVKYTPSNVVQYDLNDVIGWEEKSTGWFAKKTVTNVWCIENGDHNKLLKKKITISGDNTQQFQTHLTAKLKTAVIRPKRVLVLINPIGGNKTATDDFNKIVSPILKLAGISFDAIFSERAGHMIEITKSYDFSETNGIIILGGDGSYYEVMNVLMQKKQEEHRVDINDPSAQLVPLSIPIAMIPTGTGCGVTETNTGSKDVLTAVLHVVKGRTVLSNVLALYNDGKCLGFGGTATTYGTMTDLLYFSDRKFRWLGRLRYGIVPIWMLMFGRSTLESFDAEITYHTSVTEKVDDNESDGSRSTYVLVGDRRISGYSSYTQDKVIFRAPMWNVMTLNGNVMFDGRVCADVPRMFVPKIDTCTSFLYFNSVSMSKIIRVYRDLTSRKTLEDCKPEWEALNVRGLEVKIHEKEGTDRESEKYKLRHLIQLDGEMHTMTKLEYQIWYKENVVTIFSSYIP